MPNVVKTDGIPDDLRSDYGTQARRSKFPESNFLLVTENSRKFPVKDTEGNYHCGLIKAAMTRASQYGYSEVSTKASKLFKTFCAKEQEGKKQELHELLSYDIEGKEFLCVVIRPGFKDPDDKELIFDSNMIREACYSYNSKGTVACFRHKILLTNEQAEVVESYCLPVETKISDTTLEEGTWVQRWRVYDDELKEMIKSGEIKGLSLGGFSYLE